MAGCTEKFTREAVLLSWLEDGGIVRAAKKIGSKSGNLRS